MIVDIRDAFDSLRETLFQFTLQWLDDVQQAEVFEIAVNTNGLAPKTIDVNRLTGHAAIEQAVKAFQTLHFLPNQHPATAYRLPGWIGVSRDLSAEIAKVNQQKDALKALMLAIPERERNRCVRQALPSVSVLQCYRHLVQWSPAPECLYFSWAGATPSSVHVSRVDVMKQLDRALLNVPEQFSTSEWQAVIDLQRKQLADVPIHLPLIYRWLKAPHPRIMAYNKGQTSNAGRIVPANLPVFVVVDSENTPKVHGLDNFDITDHLRETPRADAALLANVIDSLGLYAQVKPPKNVKEVRDEHENTEPATHSRNLEAYRKAIAS